MAFDSSGTFTRTAGSGADGNQVWQDDAAAGTRILASRHDTHDQDLASGLSQCLTRHGWGVPSVDIPWGGKKITNLAKPTALNDAANKDYVDNPDAAQHSRAIAGADLDGRLNFTALSGVNGITWTYADLSWVARHSAPGEANDRLVLNPTVDPDTTGPAAGLADVFIIDDGGRINSQAGLLTHNVSYEGASPRTISPGIGTILNFNNGTFSVSSNSTATITNNYATLTPHSFFSVYSSAGHSVMALDKTDTSTVCRIQGNNNGEPRWVFDLGDGAPETGVRAGSNFALHSYDNDGGAVFTEMSIDRATHAVTFGGVLNVASLAQAVTTSATLVYGGTNATTGAYLQLYGSTHATNAYDIVLGANGTYRYFYDYSAGRHYWANNVGAVMDLTTAGDLSISGQLNCVTDLHSTTTQLTLSTATGGQIFFRPEGSGSTVNQVNIDGNGSVILQSGVAAATGGIQAGKGIRSKAGETGSYAGFWINLNWNGSVLAAYANTSPIGNLTYTCDYRIKKNVQPLGSMWDKVKALNPIRYSQKAYDIWVDDDTERWGFMAHELQEQLDPSAASGVKDGPEVQSPDLMAIIAGLTKALQEAMLRIEALEAA